MLPTNSWTAVLSVALLLGCKTGVVLDDFTFRC
jgi:hypothetical protein